MSEVTDASNPDAVSSTPESAAAFWWIEKSMSDLFNSSSWDYLFPSPAACESHIALGQALSALRLIGAL